jgi:hypothetical protein
MGLLFYCFGSYIFLYVPTYLEVIWIFSVLHWSAFREFFYWSYCFLVFVFNLLFTFIAYMEVSSVSILVGDFFLFP